MFDSGLEVFSLEYNRTDSLFTLVEKFVAPNTDKIKQIDIIIRIEESLYGFTVPPQNCSWKRHIHW